MTNVRNDISTSKTDMTNRLPNEVTSKVVLELRQHFIVNGVAPVTLRDIHKRIDALRAHLAEEIRHAVSSTPTHCLNASTYVRRERRRDRGSGVVVKFTTLCP
jgi:hypothetical protein